MKKGNKLKLSIIAALSNPDVVITDYSVSIDTEKIPSSVNDKDISDGWEKSRRTGYAVYIIEIYKEPKK